MFLTTSANRIAENDLDFSIVYDRNDEMGLLCKAFEKMRSALDEMVVMGVETNLDFQYQIMKNQVFCDGKADTGFIENVLKIKG